MGKKKYNEDEDYSSDFGTGKYTKIDEYFDNSIYEDNIEDMEDSGLEDEINVDELLKDDTKTNIPERKKRVTNAKPKLMGKHSLAHDNIFKGKKTDTSKEVEEEYIIKNVSGSFEITEDALHNDSIDYQRNLKLQQEIYDILKNSTDIKFTGPRRIKSEYDLNNYYKILLEDLFQFNYTKTEIFVTLSEYFSDNIWSIFIKLNNEYKDAIILELTEKYGKKGLNKIDFF